MHWQGDLKVRVEGQGLAEKTAEFDVGRTISGLARAQARGPEGALRDALCCPVDQASLSSAAGRLVCGSCARSYPLAGTVPVLLIEAAE